MKNVILINKILFIIENIKNFNLIEFNIFINILELIFNLNINNNNIKNKIENQNIISNEKEEEDINKEYTLIIENIDNNQKISTLKLIRLYTGLGLKESKDIIDNLPHILKEKVLKIEADKIKKEFELIGSKIIFK